MIHYLLDTYDGPLVLSQRVDSWVIATPCRPLEVFTGTIPLDCLANARRISTSEDDSMEYGSCAFLLAASEIVDLEEQP